MQGPSASGLRFIYRGLVTLLFLGLFLLFNQGISTPNPAQHSSTTHGRSSFTARGLTSLLDEPFQPRDNTTAPSDAPIEEPSAVSILNFAKQRNFYQCLVSYSHTQARKQVTCSAAAIANAADKCEFIRTVEDCNPDGFVNYLALRYCTFGSAPWAFYTILVRFLDPEFTQYIK